MLTIGARGLAPARVLCLGAHSDDIEIGCGGTLLKLLELHPTMAVDWVVLSADGDRAREARASAERFLGSDRPSRIRLESFRERYLPYDRAVKEYFDGLGREAAPDLVLCPWQQDAHQDHRVTSELVANTFRDQLILEYEIPKYDGDLGRPAIYVQLTSAQADAKLAAIREGFPSQAERPWFSDETFLGLMRLRGIESRSPDGYAEGFHCRKLVLT
jgi:LmbE family N-acetylglucosaminyl deacetylase